MESNFLIQVCLRPLIKCSGCHFSKNVSSRIIGKKKQQQNLDGTRKGIISQLLLC